MAVSDYKLFDETQPLIAQAQQNLISPQVFYKACQTLKARSPDPLYFALLNQKLDFLPQDFSLLETLKVLDYLAQKFRVMPPNCPQYWSVTKIRIKIHNQTINGLKFTQEMGCCPSPHRLNITLEKYSDGMIGRVIKLRLNNSEPLAFKSFFDPDFVWQHGVFAEIPLGIWLTAQGVTKDLPIFKLAGETWAIWEWIDDKTSPYQRQGVTYNCIAQKYNLIALNPLNRSNYNPHNIRLDLGGIQPNFRGRRWLAIVRGTCFYARKLRQEGCGFLRTYLNRDRVLYLIQRLSRELRLLFPEQGGRRRSRRMF
ncbi:MAG: hypothetical protein ACLFV6_13000 [Spirulinaceae cyanobacterium]